MPVETNRSYKITKDYHNRYKEDTMLQYHNHYSHQAENHSAVIRNTHSAAQSTHLVNPSIHALLGA